MRGSYIQVSLIIGLLLSFLTSGSQATEHSGSIALLLSSSEQAYATAADAFASETQQKVNTFVLSKDTTPSSQVRSNLLATKPRLILALGAKAAYMAKIWTKEHQEIPVVFAMVINWKRYDLLDGQSNMTGIASEMSVGTQFVNLTTFVPETKRIGVIYSKDFSATLLQEAKDAAAMLGLELVPKVIDRPDEFQLAYKKISSEIDSFWVLNDPVTFTLENMDWLARRCIKDRLVCFGQSKNIVKQGMFFAVSSDFTDIGIQAASLARNILRGNQEPEEIGVMAPLGTQILVNSKTAKQIGLQVDPVALNMATEVVE